MTAQAACGAVVLSALVAFGGLGPTPVLAAKPRNGRIAFVSWRDGRIAYYAMDGDGKRVDRLSSVPIWSGAPAAWSPDGARLAYTYEVEAGGYAVAVLDMGSRITRTVSPPGAYSFESWSPDGRRLAGANVVTIAHGPGGKAWNDGPSHIYVAGADGAGWSAATEGPAWDRSPTWAPDGKSIAFISNRDGSDELYVLRLERGSPRRLTFEGTRVETPRWSPDGLRIVVLAQRGARRVLLSVPVKGGAAQPLTPWPWAGEASWSPDGRRIACVAKAAGDEFQVWVGRSDGTDWRRVTDVGYNSAPAWSPDGKRIAFLSQRDGNNEIYVMSADGTGQENLTRHPAMDTLPSWQVLP